MNELEKQMIVTVIGSAIMLLGGIILFFSVATNNEMFIEIGTWILASGICIIVSGFLIIDIISMKRKRIKKFIENPDAFMTVNPRFCDHKFVNDICSNCGIKKEEWMKESPYNM